MAYPKKLLNDYETIKVDLHPHWWFFVRPVLALIASVALGVVAVIFEAHKYVLWVVVILIVASLIWLAARYAKWSTTNFVITSDRIIFRNGVIAKSGIEIPLENVNTVLSHQSVFERLIGAGDLLIESAGETGQQRFTDIRGPGDIQNMLHAAREDNNARMYSGNDGQRAATDVATQLEKLEGMLERGTLTQEEFDTQKRRLLSD
ncbi:MAG: hypothetical protein CSA55_02050 [Ilumatobacter coccineus]|uniref:DUF304 domain-containing protein n=1 Tax=Ilumatobacter coccineus TaxID=467094 RepID=A0A2G6KCF7_9ACTN|nr:MAG: hypothetical protein CSA55_02050 [Ilumatobacter coccineus]